MRIKNSVNFLITKCRPIWLNYLEVFKKKYEALKTEIGQK